MTEGTPPTPEEIRQLNRDLMQKILDKAAKDPVWKQLLLDNPEAAILEAGFPEAERLREMQASVEAAREETEVQGQMEPRSCSKMRCYSSTLYWDELAASLNILMEP